MGSRPPEIYLLWPLIKLKAAQLPGNPTFCFTMWLSLLTPDLSKLSKGIKLQELLVLPNWLMGAGEDGPGGAHAVDSSRQR